MSQHRLVMRRTRLRRIPYDPKSWEEALHRYPTSEVFHSPAWLAFLTATRGVEPIVAEVHEQGHLVGHFVGAVVRRFGLRMLGSPLAGWGTPVMGLLLDQPSRRRAALDALLDFAYGSLGCAHLEIGDRYVTEAELVGSRYRVTIRPIYLIDLDAPDEVLISRMHKRTRNYVRRGGTTGLRFEEVMDVAFADEYFEQLLDVYLESDIVPNYDVHEVRQLIEILGPSGQLLMLRAIDASGRSIASSISLGRNRRAYAWGQAFLRSEAGQHPIEPLMWEVMRRWRERGALVYDLDAGDFAKSKFGATSSPELHLRHSRFPGLELGRMGLRAAIELRRRAAARLR